MSAFDKVIGYESIKKELIRYADVLKNTKKYARLGIAPMSGILLCGDPGIGKTLMAKCFIEEAQRPTYMLRKEKPNGSFVNEIKATYELAKQNAPSIVFLDDMDKFSNSDEDLKNTDEFVTIQSCIDEYKNENVFTLATVNEDYKLPDSLRRPGRFDEVINVVAPSGQNAKNIIEYFLSQKKAVGNLDIDEIVQILNGRSCAELETIINKAAIYAGYANRRKICQKDIIDAYVRMMYESPECLFPENEKENERVAIHEAGHAVVSEVLEPGSVSLVSVCRNNYSTQGITHTFRTEEYYLSKELHEKAIIRKLGGKAATEILLGTDDIGCYSDLREAHDMVERLVDDYATFGFEAHTNRYSSSAVQEKCDELVAKELNRYYKIAKKIIVENRRFVETMKDELLEQRTLTCRNIEIIRGMVDAGAI